MIVHLLRFGVIDRRCFLVLVLLLFVDIWNRDFVIDWLWFVIQRPIFLARLLGRSSRNLLLIFLLRFLDFLQLYYPSFLLWFSASFLGLLLTTLHLVWLVKAIVVHWRLLSTLRFLLGSRCCFINGLRLVFDTKLALGVFRFLFGIVELILKLLDEEVAPLLDILHRPCLDGPIK